MARLLHDDGHRDGDSDVSGERSGSCDGRKRHRKHRDRHHHRKEKLIRVGNISVDCTPVVFETPGIVRSIVSCAVDQVVTVPVTRTTVVQTPTSFGCFTCTPVVEIIQVPVLTSVNVPGVLTPVPRIVCPPSVFGPLIESVTGPEVVVSSKCRCNG